MLLGALARLAMWYAYEPVRFGDDVGYWGMAQQIRALDFTDYEAIRTPGYPLLVLSVGLNDNAVWAVQSLLGIGVSTMLYFMALYFTRSVGWSVVVGLAHSLSLIQLLFEATMLSETFATFLVVLSLLPFLYLHRKRKNLLWAFLVCGVIVSAAALTRPLLITLAPVYLAAILLQSRGVALERKTRYVLAYVSPVAVLVGGWVIFNGVSADYYGVTTLTGFNLTNHSGAIMERAPSRYATLRDIYLDFREERIATRGTHHMTIWRAQNAMLQATGLSYGQLSRELTKLSLELFVREPVWYAKSVLTSWSEFWNVPTKYWKPQDVRSSGLAHWLAQGLRLQKHAFMVVNASFLIITLYLVYAAVLRRDVRVSPFYLLVIAVVLTASISQALVEQGENARYSIPFYPLMSFIALMALWYGPREARWGRLESQSARWPRPQTGRGSPRPTWPG